MVRLSDTGLILLEAAIAITVPVMEAVMTMIAEVMGVVELPLGELSAAELREHRASTLLPMLPSPPPSFAQLSALSDDGTPSSRMARHSMLLHSLALFSRSPVRKWLVGFRALVEMMSTPELLAARKGAR